MIYLLDDNCEYAYGLWVSLYLLPVGFLLSSIIFLQGASTATIIVAIIRLTSSKQFRNRSLRRRMPRIRVASFFKGKLD